MVELNNLPSKEDPRSDPLFWAKQPEEYCKQVKELLTGLDFNIDLLILGEVLYRMTGDETSSSNTIPVDPGAA